MTSLPRWLEGIVEEPRPSSRGFFDPSGKNLYFNALANPALTGGGCARCTDSRRDFLPAFGPDHGIRNAQCCEDLGLLFDHPVRSAEIV